MIVQNKKRRRKLVLSKEAMKILTKKGDAP
jgi:hypothetical protein